MKKSYRQTSSGLSKMRSREAYEFIGLCTQLTAAELTAFDATSRSCTNRTFRRKLGKEQYDDLESLRGYNSALRLRDDPCVYYVVGKWKGRKAVCMFWSEIHHIYAEVQK